MLAERLRRARIAAGHRSARAAALANGWPASTYVAHEQGTRAFNPSHAATYADRFDVPSQWLTLELSDIADLDGRSAAWHERFDILRRAPIRVIADLIRSAAGERSPDSGGRLATARERAGFRSAAEAARHYGWNRSTYHAHENG